MKSIFISDAHIIDPSQGIDSPGNLLIEGEKIVWSGNGKPERIPDEAGIIKANNLILCPGFIDLHCHLREPGYEDKETIATGTMAAARGGFTTVCCMPNTNPPVDNRSVVDYIKNKAATEGVIRVLPIGCITRERKGDALADMGELDSAGVVAFSDDGNSVMNSRILRQAMEYSRLFDLPIIEHCEDSLLAQGGQVNEGIIATRLGFPGIPVAAEESIVARDILLAELTGAKLHIAHVSTRGSVELIRQAKQRGIRVTAEVTPHHLTLTEEKVLGYDTSAKVNPPLRTAEDVKALIKGLAENVIDAIATDHAPHTRVDKQCEFATAPFGISMLETALGMLMGLVHDGKLDLPLIISKLTREPAAIIGNRAGNLGTLKTGAFADVILIDPEKAWIVDPERFASKGKNTPLAGVRLKGKVMATIYRGNLVYKDNSLKIE